jgi:polar amino acid transport system substrate-binding protein
MTKRRQLLLLTAAAFADRAHAAASESDDRDKTLVFPCYPSAAFARVSRAFETAYAAMGYRAVIEDMPTLRGLVEANNGIAAGEVIRTPFVEKQSPNLIRVPVLMDTVGVCTVTRATSSAVLTLEEAARMHVGIHKGLTNMEALAADWPNVERALNLNALLKMLDAGNVDVILVYTENFYFTLAQAGRSPDLYKIKEVKRDPLYHYLHKRHAALVPAITAELNKIKGKYPTVVEGFQARGEK